MNKVFVFPLYATVDTSFGTDLELIQVHLDKGDTVKVFTCPQALNVCDRNPSSQSSVCNRCEKKSAIGLSLLEPQNTNLAIQKITQLPNWNQKISVNFLDQVKSIDDIKTIYYDEFDIGYAILSSLITWKVDYSPSIEENSIFLKKLADASLRLYLCVDQLLQKERPDIVYVFNGRYAPMRAIFRACEKNSVKVFTHDRGHDLYSYSTFENALPHNTNLFIRNLWAEWKRADPTQRTRVAEKWFEDRSNGLDTDAWISFTKSQDIQLLPSDWNVRRRNISIFTSSEHEFASIDKEWENKLFKNQILGIDFILEFLQSEIKQDKIHVYIRTHPNQANANARELNELLSLERQGVTLITPDSKISSYKLVQKSDLVITFGSTIGIEAVYWGTTSILLGQSLYKQLNATYNPDTLEELQMLLKKELEPKPSSLALPYAYYQSTFGDSYTYYEPTGLLTGKFKGHDLEPKVAIYHTFFLKIRTFINGVFRSLIKKIPGATYLYHSLKH